ncbi:MAG: cell division protein FtsQ/DivIB, partial [Vicinamibacteria bacterium]
MTPKGPERREQDLRFLRGQLHRQRATRRVGRLRLSRLALVLSLALAAAGVWAAVGSGRAPELDVDRILVEGNERLSDGEIRELIDVDETTNLLTLNLEEVRGKLLRSAWVRDVELKRMLPSTISLQIAERTPVAIAVLDELYLLAEDGTLLDQLPPFYDVKRLVLVRGIRGPHGIGVSPERSALAGRMADALLSDERLSTLVSELDVAGGADSMVLRLREPAVTLLASERTMVSRLLEIVPLLSGIRDRLPSLEIVDLRFQKRVYLR